MLCWCRCCAYLVSKPSGADEHCAIGAPGDDLDTLVPPVKSEHFGIVQTRDSLCPVFIVDLRVTWTDHPRHTALSPTWVALELVQIYPSKLGRRSAVATVVATTICSLRRSVYPEVEDHLRRKTNGSVVAGKGGFGYRRLMSSSGEPSTFALHSLKPHRAICALHSLCLPACFRTVEQPTDE